MNTRFIDRSKHDVIWNTFYVVGGAAALVAVVFFRRNFSAELAAFKGFGLFDMPASLPDTATGWFTLFQEKKLLGLLLFNIVDLVNYALVGLIFLALFGALREVNRTAMLAALILGLAGILVYFASNQAFAMLRLSNQYLSATSEVQRTSILAAGEASLGINNPGVIYQGAGIYASLFLVILAGLIISFVMLRDNTFSKATGWVGIVANGCVLFYFLTLMMAPNLVAIPHVISAPFRITWYVLIALRLFKLARAVPAKELELA
jgi:hypothetical protein